MLDKPKATHSPQRQLTSLMEIDRCVKEGAQFDEDDIINAKMTQNEAKYPVEKARGSAAKYD